MKARILLVDDHEMVRKGLKAMISETADCEVCGEATNGKEAIERALELHPDVVVMDISMPVMNGLEAAMQIRQLTPAAKIIVLTMHDSPQVAHAVIRAGAHAYLTKTQGAEELCSEIAQLLGRTNVVSR